MKISVKSYKSVRQRVVQRIQTSLEAEVVYTFHFKCQYSMVSEIEISQASMGILEYGAQEPDDCGCARYINVRV